MKVPADEKHVYAMDFQTWIKNKITSGTFLIRHTCIQKPNLHYKWFQYYVSRFQCQGAWYSFAICV